MASNIKPWRVLALEAHQSLGTARLLIDCSLDEVHPDALAARLKLIRNELERAQDLVRQIGQLDP